MKPARAHRWSESARSERRRPRYTRVRTMSPDLTVEIFTREGLLSVPVPAEIVDQIRAAYEDDSHAGVLELAALLLLRMGREHGTSQLRTWLESDPGYLGMVPQAARRQLAFRPETFARNADRP